MKSRLTLLMYMCSIKWISLNLQRLIYTINRLGDDNVRVVSACLCGINCKYNGANNVQELFLNELRQGLILPICPEQLGGLTTPRSAGEIVGGSGDDVLAGRARVINIAGEDMSAAFIKGAQECLVLMQLAGIDEAVLQRRSPSCGVGRIYDGSFSGHLIAGDGVTTALLKKHGIKVWNDEDYLQNRGACNL
jgi:uncharacterized protein YbbK (DUF523 family)